MIRSLAREWEKIRRDEEKEIRPEECCYMIDGVVEAFSMLKYAMAILIVLSEMYMQRFLESPRLGCGIMEMEETTFDWTLGRTRLKKEFYIRKELNAFFHKYIDYLFTRSYVMIYTYINRRNA